MDKGRRNELKMLKYVKRLRNYGLLGVEGHLVAFRTTGKPCSKVCCQPKGKYNRAKSKRGMTDREIYGISSMAV